MIAESFWGTDTGLIVVLVAAFAAVYLLIRCLVGSSRRGPSATDARNPPRPSGRGGRTDDPASQWMPDAFAQAGQRFAVATGFNAGLDERLEQAGMSVLAGEFVALTVFCAVLGGVFAALLLQNIVFILLLAAVACLVPYAWMMWSLRRRQDRLVEPARRYAVHPRELTASGLLVPPSPRHGLEGDRRALRE